LDVGVREECSESFVASTNRTETWGDRVFQCLPCNAAGVFDLEDGMVDNVMNLLGNT